MKNHMKLFLFTCLIMLNLSFLASSAQENKLLKRDLYIDLGFKYTPFDYIGGPAFGLSLYSPDKKLAFNFRYDIGFSIGKGIDTEVIDSIYISTPQEHFSIQNFQVRTFLEAEYLLWKADRQKLFASAGLGWNYMGLDQKVLLNESSGYYCLTIAAKYKINWFYIEPRVDIPISEFKYSGDKLFPASIALIYRFKPKKVE